MDEDLVRVLMARLWDAAQYPSQAFEPAWQQWQDNRRDVSPDDDGERRLAEIAGAVADEMCRTRPCGEVRAALSA